MRTLGQSQEEWVTENHYDDNSWHQVTVSVDRNNGVKLYMDGSLASLHQTGTVLSGTVDEKGTGDWMIGDIRNAGISGNTIGSLDDILVYTRALTPTEVSRLYSYGLSKRYRDEETVVKAKFPDKFVLSSNIPNPFNPTTTLQYQVPFIKDGLNNYPIKISIYDLSGKLIKSLVDEHKKPGFYSATWNGNTIDDKPAASGIYLCRMRAGNFVGQQKILLAK